MFAAAMETREFNDLRELIMRVVGIQLADSKRTLLEGRLAPIVRRRQLAGYRDYLDRLHDDSGMLSEMVNAVTTNKTSFFRENHHFTMLGDILRKRGRDAAPYRVWSAGCSSGEEPYTIAMTARDAGAPIRVTATDVDTNVLAKAARGVYPDDQRDELSSDAMRRHFLQGRGAQDGMLRVRPEVQQNVKFMQLNLIHPSWPMRDPFDAIFCRNVVIYFDRATQDRLFRRYAELLVPGGLLFLGHSESVAWLSDLFEPIGHTVYRLRSGHGRSESARTVVTHAATVPVERAPVIRIDAGDIQASRKPCEMRTVLGSCIAACLYDPIAKVGGMNHFMLPDGADSEQPARYGVHAMELLINNIMKLGGDRSRLRAKVFGGANVIRMERSAVDVGRDNVEFVRRFLADERIPIDGEKLGGTRPLEVRMDSTTGRVKVRALGAETLGDLIDAERTRQATHWRPTTRPADDVNDILF